MPAFAKVHLDPAIALHIILEQQAVFRMFLVEQYPVLRASQASCQLWRTRVVAQLAIRVHFMQHLHVVRRQQRQIRLAPQACDTFQVFTGTAGLVALQVIQTNAGVGVEIGKRLLLARHQGDEAGQGQVFEHIGVIAGMEGVTIIHGCSCEGREVYLLPAGKSGVRG
ncbi:hypothetical protein D3C78_1297880 [compost metagenome]